MKIYLDTVGCRLNQAEIERYAREFHAAGHHLVSNPNDADLAVINTCAVTSAAVADSRQKIRMLSRSRVGKLVATGCWVTLKPQEAAELLGSGQIVANMDKDQLVPELLSISTSQFDQEPLERVLIPGARLRTRAFIKAQDGCNNRCTFCVTTLARGQSRSRTIAEIVRDIQDTLRSIQPDGSENGLSRAAQEIVLTGVHLGSWGRDFRKPLHLMELVRAILADTDVPRLRLSSLEPWDLDDCFFSLWQDSRLCRHLHLPLQSGSADTLRRMARKTTPTAFAELAAAARSSILGVAITTDIIVGFPGETAIEFEESREFVRQMQFADGHVFTYSARPGTAAASMHPQVAHSLAKDRNAQVRTILHDSARQFQAGFIGQVMPVLWESATSFGPQGWELSGLTDNYLRIHTRSAHPAWNQITPVRIIESRDDGLRGSLIA